MCCTELKVHHGEKLMTSPSLIRPQDVAYNASRWAGFPPGPAGVRQELELWELGHRPEPSITET